MHSTDVKNVDFGVGFSDVTIELDGKSSLSDKSTLEGSEWVLPKHYMHLKKRILM